MRTGNVYLQRSTHCRPEQKGWEKDLDTQQGEEVQRAWGRLSIHNVTLRVVGLEDALWGPDKTGIERDTQVMDTLRSSY